MASRSISMTDPTIRQLTSEGCPFKVVKIMEHEDSRKKNRTYAAAGSTTLVWYLPAHSTRRHSDELKRLFRHVLPATTTLERLEFCLVNWRKEEADAFHEAVLSPDWPIPCVSFVCSGAEPLAREKVLDGLAQSSRVHYLHIYRSAMWNLSFLETASQLQHFQGSWPNITIPNMPFYNEHLPLAKNVPHYNPHPVLACDLAHVLSQTKALRTLKLSNLNITWGTDGHKQFGRMLEHNRIMETLQLNHMDITAERVAPIATALMSNTVLTSMDLRSNPLGYDGVITLMQPLERDPVTSTQRNSTLRSLTLGGEDFEIWSRVAVSAIANMISSNTSLTKLEIIETRFSSNQVMQLLTALANNIRLTSFSLQGCTGCSGERVFDQILKVLQANHRITKLNLQGTGLGELKLQRIKQRLEFNEKKQLYPLQNMPRIRRASARLFFCGFEFAGKTSLCQSMKRNLAKKTFFGWIKNMPALRVAPRTTGIELSSITYKNMKFSVWDLGGQVEYHALHDLVFPSTDGPAFFVLVCSLLSRHSQRQQASTADSLKADLLYWLQFISSTKQSNFTPQAVVVFTHEDQVSSKNWQKLQECARICVEELKTEFQQHVCIHDLFFVNALDDQRVKPVTKFLEHIRGQLLEQGDTVYKVCDEIRLALELRSQHNTDEVVLNWGAFKDICLLRIKSNSSEEDLESFSHTVASVIHDSGDVIYFPTLNLVITNPRWFCHNFLGRILETNNPMHSNGDDHGMWTEVSIDTMVEASLRDDNCQRNLTGKIILKLLEEMELAFEVNESAKAGAIDMPKKWFIPASLRKMEDMSQHNWSRGQSDCVYIGRRLQCKDPIHTFLTPGFFPRVQVYLRKKFQETVSVFNDGINYSLAKDLIWVKEFKGMEIVVESSGEHTGSFIDILVCSVQNRSHTLNLLHKHVIDPIKELLSASQHWKGITLVEGVIRPMCVERRSSIGQRQGQNVLIERLKQELLQMPIKEMQDWQHPWPATENMEAGQNKAMELLGEDDCVDMLSRRGVEMVFVAPNLKVDLTPESGSTSNSSSPSSSNHASPEPNTELQDKVQEILLRVKENADRVGFLISSLSRMESTLVHMIDAVFNYTCTLQECIVPRFFYFTPDEATYSLLHFLKDSVLGCTSLHLRILCESRAQRHVVPDQPGCHVTVAGEHLRKVLPYARKVLCMLLMALKVGAHVVGGVENMVPNFTQAIALAFDTNGLDLNTCFRLVEQVNDLTDARDGDDPPADQWLLTYLKNRELFNAESIEEKFKLTKVRYTDDHGIAWVCHHHLRSGLDQNILRKVAWINP